MPKNNMTKIDTVIESKGGRPTDYTPALAEEICNAVACASKGVKKLCEDNKHWPSSFTVFNWLRNNEEFSHQYARAKMVQIAILVDEMLDIAADADDVNRARLEIDTRKWLACKLVPKVYGNKIDATVEVGLSHADWLDRLS